MRQHSNNNKHTVKRGFTIIELLVVISIIALLIGILLPAISKARDSARVSQSSSNARQISQAMQIYASEHNDRQFTAVNDQLSVYGGFGGYQNATGIAHPPMVYGLMDNNTILVHVGVWRLPIHNGSASGNGFDVQAPEGGTYRLHNVEVMNQYMNGRFYDPVYWAPKDRGALRDVSQYFNMPGDFVHPNDTGGEVKLSSYSLSPAAMVHPEVLSSKNGLQHPMELSSGYKSPSIGQARFADQKSMVLEEHHLQNTEFDCNPHVSNGMYEGCQPYFFNASPRSNPVGAFYDGSTGTINLAGSATAHNRIFQQSTQADNEPTGLWHLDVFGGAGAGYYSNNQSVDWPGWFDLLGATAPAATPSPHTGTADGILGRDRIAD